MLIPLWKGGDVDSITRYLWEKTDTPAYCAQPREQRQSVVKPEPVSLVPNDMVPGKPEPEIQSWSKIEDGRDCGA